MTRPPNMKRPSTKMPGAMHVVRARYRSRDTAHRRVRKNEGLAGTKAKPNVSALDLLPFCEAIGDESADIGHHKVLRRIGMETAIECGARCP